MTSKNCSKCKEKKQLSSFSKDKEQGDGLKMNCRACCKIFDDAYRHTINGLVYHIYNNQKTSSRNRNHQPPEYTKHELLEWLHQQPSFHALYLNWINSGYNKMKRPSVDRKNDYLPYTICNLLRVCTWQENFDRGHADRVNGINNKKSKAINQLTMDNKFIQKFYSAAQASRVLNISKNNIVSVRTGKRVSAGGFKWEYAVD